MNNYSNIMTRAIFNACVTRAPADDAGAEFSLADLADLDVSEIEEIRFENLPAGVFDLEVADADLHEKTNNDGEKRFTAEFTFKVVEAVSVIERGVNKESLAGKSHTEKLYINPALTEEEVAKAIGRVRAMVTDLGGDSKGKLGDIVRNTKGLIVRAKITKQKDRNDPTREYARVQLTAKK